jgi:DNA replication ATP-dependent helicase Dna2
VGLGVAAVQAICNNAGMEDQDRSSASDARSRHSLLLQQLRRFVADERQADSDRLALLWSKPLHEKLDKGISQRFVAIERRDAETLWAYVDTADSRFRQGDLMCLHTGDPRDPLARQVSLEAEEDDRWLLRRGRERSAAFFREERSGPCFADPDSLDLSPYYEKAFADVASSQRGQEILMPLLAGDLDLAIDGQAMNRGIRAGRSAGLNHQQCLAVGRALGAKPVACIQGPPGTGKTRVLALAAGLMVARGDRVLLTAPTHTAINHALGRVAQEGVPVVKIGRASQRAGLPDAVPSFDSYAAWAKDRPTEGGYVLGATPFATVSGRLEACEFDIILFDEASQLTVPLALMAMRTARKFVFIGDQRQLPPVVLSRSVLDGGGGLSVFAALTDGTADHAIMLHETFRMNRWLAAWPSATFYEGKLQPAPANRERRLVLGPIGEGAGVVSRALSSEASSIFIPTTDVAARAQNRRDAELVSDLCAGLVEAGLLLRQIGVVTPYRAQGRLVRTLLQQRFGRPAAAEVIADTVERMQGQEREVVILTLATGDPGFLAAVAEFFFRPERLNVSVTRAMTKLFVIGPDLGALQVPDHPEVSRWIGLYRGFIASCHRVEV